MTLSPAAAAQGDLCVGGISDSSSRVVLDEVAPKRGDSLGNAEPREGAGSTMRTFSFSFFSFSFSAMPLAAGTVGVGAGVDFG
jgi:hypothetical protein